MVYKKEGRGMKALTIHPYFAMQIVGGVKTVEVRTWKTDFRGDILITSSAKKGKYLVPGHALGVVTLKDIVPLTKKHLKAALLDRMPEVDAYAWILENPRFIKPIPVKGKLSLWTYPDDTKIEYLHPTTQEELQELLDTYWEPITC